MSERKNYHFRDVPKKIPCPSEDEEQATLFAWAKCNESVIPELALMFHIPNGGLRSKSEAARFKRQGVKPGVPDICLPCARGQFHGLYIELKRKKGGRVSDAQIKFGTALTKEGYAAYVCKGWEDASDTILCYLEGRLP